MSEPDVITGTAMPAASYHCCQASKPNIQASGVHTGLELDIVLDGGLHLGVAMQVPDCKS